MKISILGLGWLGYPLANSLLSHGYAVNGSTTSISKLETFISEGHKCYKVVLNEAGVEGEITELLKQSEVLVLNVPPGLRRNPSADFVSKIRQLVPYIEKSSVNKVLFIGSTSVFADSELINTITNNTIPNSETVAGKQLAEVENILMSNSNFKTTILRFAGLLDASRHPARMISKRKQIPNPLAPVNLIHRNDCIALIEQVINLKKWNKVYNAAYPLHPSKKDYYTAVCALKKLTSPDFKTEGVSSGKLIDGQATSKNLEYAYNHPIL